MIAKSTGTEPFDYAVTEAYWIGNSLLDAVPPAEFFEFSHQNLGGRIKKSELRTLFKEYGSLVKPHHTFYVLGMYSKTSPSADNKRKLLELMDSVGISWRRVVEVLEKELDAAQSPQLIFDTEGRLQPAKPATKRVTYDGEITPFGNILPGDYVSFHWNFASDKLSSKQLRNIKAYTAIDTATTNSLAGWSASG